MRHGFFAVMMIAGISITSPLYAQTEVNPSNTLQVLSNVTTATDFVNGAAASDKFEINISNLAQGNTTNAAIREFAAKMVNDHSKSTQQLLATAKAVGMSVTPPPALNSPHEALVNMLIPLRNDAFDTKFIEIQIQAHTEAVALFTSYAARGDTPELKEFAATMLPTLQHHLDMITAMKTK